jgi:hypothetical protein
MKRITAFCFAVVSCMLGPSLSATAAPIFLTAPTVTSINRAATFDILTSNIFYTGSYTEDLLSVTTPINQSISVPFTAFAPGDLRDTAFYYASGGSNSYVEIKGTDSAVFTAVDFLLGDGQALATTNLRWQTFLNGSLTGAGFQLGISKGGLWAGWIRAVLTCCALQQEVRRKIPVLETSKPLPLMI